MILHHTPLLDIRDLCVQLTSRKGTTFIVDHVSFTLNASETLGLVGESGSGKSMIMLHRLPILLYDNPNSLSRTNLYVITPSQMYIQLAENMRHQLEISDINMGTIEQYFDYCIAKYAGHKAGEYGKINYGSKISSDNEKYVYSQKCISDIINYFESIGSNEVSLDKAYIPYLLFS